MALLGPMVVIAENSAAELMDILGRAGAFPIVEARRDDAPVAIAQIAPAAIAVADPDLAGDTAAIQGIADAIESVDGPFMPVIAWLNPDAPTPPLGALPVDNDESPGRLVTRIRSALRVRAIHGTVIRRAEAAGVPGTLARALLDEELLDDATLLCIGRGRAYPELSVAVGERVRVVGALSIEAAARYIGTRDIDGIVIGDGFSQRMVTALLTTLADDPRFRDMPIGVLGCSTDGYDGDSLPNLIRIEGEASHLVERLLPYVKLQVHEGRLRRLLKTLESHGLLDHVTGLFDRGAFWDDLEAAVKDAAERGAGLSVARIALEGADDRRSQIDAARLLARMVREVDMACQDDDGSILLAFPGTDLRTAHVIARRIAASLKDGAAAASQARRKLSPTVTLATLKPNDNLYTLMARISAYPMVAAE